MSASEVQETYYRWYEKEYAKCCGLVNLPERFPETDDLVKRFEYGYSSIWRHECLANMKYFAITRKVEYSVSAFSAIRKQNKATYRTIYAFVYTFVEGNKISHEYVSSCPTFKSMDGEYRHRFINLPQFDRAYDASLVCIKGVEEYVQKQIKLGELNLAVETLTPENDPRLAKKIEKSLDRLKMALRCYVSSWLIDYDRYAKERLENHLSDGYVPGMFGIRDVSAHKEFEAECAKFPKPLLIRYYKSADQSQSVLELGQKLIPLTIREVEECENIQYGPWREIYIASLVSDLVINGVGPMFPILNDWFFLKNSSPSLYDNPVNHIRARYSEEASEIIQGLEDVRKKTYVVDPINKKELYFSYNMEGLSQAIEIPVEFAEAQVIQSPVALVTVTEHIGRTLGDLLMLMRDERYRKIHGEIFSDFPTFAKYIFEVVYGLYAFNYHYGGIHTDLHLNNATTFMKRPVYNLNDGKLAFPEPRCLYEVNGQLYLFPHFGAYAALIDYSRALLSRQHIKENFDPRQVPEILADQKRRILQAYQTDLPDFYQTHLIQLEQALILNYDTVHRITEAIDTYKFSKGWLHILDELLANPALMKLYGNEKMLKEQAIPLLKRIQARAMDFMVQNLQKLFSANLPKEGAFRAESLPRPNLNILEAEFAEFRFTKQKVTLVDYHRVENPLTYNVREYDQFPPTVKLDYVKKHRVPGEIEAVKRFRLYESYLKEPVDEKVEAVKQAAIDSRAERRGLPEELREEYRPGTGAKKGQAAALAASANDYYYSS